MLLPLLLVQVRRGQGGGGEIGQRLARLHVHVAETVWRPIVEDKRSRSVGCRAAWDTRAWNGYLRRGRPRAVPRASGGRQHPGPPTDPRSDVAAGAAAPSIRRDHAAGEGRGHAVGLATRQPADPGRRSRRRSRRRRAAAAQATPSRREPSRSRASQAGRLTRRPGSRAGDGARRVQPRPVCGR